MRSSIAASTLLLAAVVAANAPAPWRKPAPRARARRRPRPRSRRLTPALRSIGRARADRRGECRRARLRRARCTAEHRNDEALRGARRRPEVVAERRRSCASCAAWCSTSSGRSDEAVEVFRGAHPGLPRAARAAQQPRRAVRRARRPGPRPRGARRSGPRALPSYALAHENLGDIHLRLAVRAYERAAVADRANDAARTKLALARELIAQRVRPRARPAAAR